MTILHLLDLTGVGVFAVSGALAAGRKHLDLFGVVVIALVTAIGGGTIRDVLLDRHPIFWISNTAYLAVIFAATALTIVWVRVREPPFAALLVADALGLALFAISGAQIAERMALPSTVVVMMGTITGVAGGMIRDVLTTEIPLVLRKGTLYASTAIVGIAVYLMLRSAGTTPTISSAIGMFTVIVLRFTSIIWGLSLPVFKVEEAESRKQ